LNKKSQFIVICLFLVLLNFWSRHAAAPVVDYTSDSWGMLSMSQLYESPLDIFGIFLKEVDRPVGTTMNVLLNYFIGDNAFGMSLYGIAAFSVHMIVAMWLVFLLSGCRTTTLIFGLIYSVLPNVYEFYQWGMMIGVAYMEIFYLLSAALWILYLKKGNYIWAVLGAFLHVCAVASYEFGIMLPGVYCLLFGWETFKKRVWGLAPYAAFLLFYLAWRFTDGFGMAQGVFFESRKPVIAPWLIWEIIRELVSWWIGPRMGLSIVNGLMAFTTLTALKGFLLILVNTILIVIGMRLLVKSSGSPEVEVVEEQTGFSFPRLVLFSLAWIVACHSLSLVSWTASRLNLLPAFGVLLLLAICLKRIKLVYYIGPLSLILWIGLIANQGNSKAWEDVGIFNRNIYNHLIETEAQWEDKKLIYLDFSQVHHRSEKDLFSPTSKNPQIWSTHYNATLWRGFVTGSMLKLIRKHDTSPAYAMSNENGGRIEGEQFIWHKKYEPESVYTNQLSSIYFIDALAEGAGYNVPTYKGDQQ